MCNVQLTDLQKATALLAVAAVTIGVAGDKLAAEHIPGTGPILERITEVLNDLGAISDWLTECLLKNNEIPASNAAADSALLTGTGETSGGNVHGPVKSAMLP